MSAWQDPFAAAARAFELSKRGLEQQCQDKPSRDSACASPLTVEDEGTLVLGVTVPGAPYSEDAERRRRSRYVVLAGLARHGFAPSDARHIGYFLWTEPDEMLSPGRDRPPIPLQLPRHALTPLSQLYEDRQDRITSAAPIPPPPGVVPYERFEKTLPRPIPYLSLNAPRKTVLVMWLNEELLRGEPLHKISELMKFLGGAWILKRSATG